MRRMTDRNAFVSEVMRGELEVENDDDMETWVVGETNLTSQN